MTSAEPRRRKVVFKLTFPNGKIFVAKDLFDNTCNLGEVDSGLVARDFTRRQLSDFTLRKEILWESEDAPDDEVAAVEIAYIRALGANDPAMGYNRWPELKHSDD